MVRVRFPNGQCVQYNEVANWLFDANGVSLLNCNKGCLAFVPFSSGAIVEWIFPCSVKNPIHGLTEETALELILQEARNLTGRDKLVMLSGLKKLLGNFNARTHLWKRK